MFSITFTIFSWMENNSDWGKLDNGDMKTLSYRPGSVQCLAKNKNKKQTKKKNGGICDDATWRFMIEKVYIPGFTAK